jgi:hypothetical protein
MDPGGYHVGREPSPHCDPYVRFRAIETGEEGNNTCGAAPMHWPRCCSHGVAARNLAQVILNLLKLHLISEQLHLIIDPAQVVKTRLRCHELKGLRFCTSAHRRSRRISIESYLHLQDIREPTVDRRTAVLRARHQKPMPAPASQLQPSCRDTADRSQPNLTSGRSLVCNLPRGT